jgi:hypothetical protein
MCTVHNMDSSTDYRLIGTQVWYSNKNEINFSEKKDRI